MKKIAIGVTEEGRHPDFTMVRLNSEHVEPHPTARIGRVRYWLLLLADMIYNWRVKVLGNLQNETDKVVFDLEAEFGSSGSFLKEFAARKKWRAK